MAQELLTIPEHMSSPPIFYEIRVARSSVFCVVFCGSLFFLLSLVARLSVLVLSLVAILSVLVLSLVARLSVLVGFYTILSKTKKDHQIKCTAAWYRGQFLGFTFSRLFLYETR